MRQDNFGHHETINMSNIIKQATLKPKVSERINV